MKITKFPQSCLLIETKDKRILIDPGNLKYKEEYFDIWNNVDIILITHKHPDHCNTEILENLDKNIKIYSTQEVQDANKNLNINIIKENDIIQLDSIKIEVVHAIHGYQPLLKGAKEINENVGYIIDDGENRLYSTSDSICFKNEYKADILCIPVTGHGLTMSAFEAALYAKEIGATLTIPIHMDNPAFPPDFEFIKEMFEKYEVEYEILENDERNIAIINASLSNAYKVTLTLLVLVLFALIFMGYMSKVVFFSITGVIAVGQITWVITARYLDKKM